jgi:UDP-glucose 4-epimerase
MHILVTGSSGTIGTRLCEKLLRDGHTVTGIDWVKNIWQESVESITTHIDLRDQEKLDAWKPSSPIDVVVHLAANARVYELVGDPARARDNMMTLWNMLEYTRKNTIPRFLFASSREGYGNIDAERFTEDLVRVENCESPYTASKVGGEAFVQAYRRCYGIKTVILRFSNVYGMYDESNRVVPLFIRQVRASKKLTVFGETKCLDFTYIDDTVNGICLALKKFDDVQGETFNIAYGEGTTIMELARVVQELLQTTVGVDIQPSRIGEVNRYIAEIEKAKKSLGYAPTVSFSEGIRKSVTWYLENVK